VLFRSIPVYFDNKPEKKQDIKARVMMRVDNTISPYMHQYIVINKGSEAGVKLGDFFKVMDREHPKRFAEALVEAQAVNVTGKSSTLLLQKVYRERLGNMDEAYLNFRAAVKQ
jgi:cell shape-determining protein MreC